MKNFYLLSLVCLFSISGCKTSQSPSRISNQVNGSYLLEKQFKDYVPVSPIEFEQDVEIVNADGSTSKIPIKKFSTDRTKILQFLPNEAVYTSVQKIDGSGEIKYGPASVTAEAGTYNIILDYCKFTTLKVVRENGSCPGFAKVGIGFRIRASISTFEGGVDISSLFALGVSARAGKLRGQISVDIIGMEGGQITDLISLPVDISEASIQTALQSMAAIKTKIYENGTRLYPQIVAVKKSSNSDCSVFELLDTVDPEGKTTIKTRGQQQQQQQQDR